MYYRCHSLLYTGTALWGNTSNISQTLIAPSFTLSHQHCDHSMATLGYCSRMDCYRCLDTLLSHPRGVTWGSTACGIIGTWI
jgi:hypothetical protein